MQYQINCCIIHKWTNIFIDWSGIRTGDLRNTVPALYPWAIQPLLVVSQNNCQLTLFVCYSQKPWISQVWIRVWKPIKVTKVYLPVVNLRNRASFSVDRLLMYLRRSCEVAFWAAFMSSGNSIIFRTRSVVGSMSEYIEARPFFICGLSSCTKTSRQQFAT